MPTNMMSSTLPKPILISIDGLIGSGKSTLLNQLRENYPHWHFIDEPLDTWQALKNEAGESLLEVFYKDKRRWSYTFQNCAVLSRYQNIRHAIEQWQRECVHNPELEKHNVFITERSLETDFNVFAQMLRDEGAIDAMEWDLYKKWYRMLQDSCHIDAIIYVNTSPEVSLERIGIRGRQGEGEIPLDYLQNLHKYHLKWIDRIASPVMLYNNYLGGQKGHNQPDDVDRFIQRL